MNHPSDTSMPAGVTTHTHTAERTSRSVGLGGEPAKKSTLDWKY